MSKSMFIPEHFSFVQTTNGKSLSAKKNGKSFVLNLFFFFRKKEYLLFHLFVIGLNSFQMFWLRYVYRGRISLEPHDFVKNAREA